MYNSFTRNTIKILVLGTHLIPNQGRTIKQKIPFRYALYLKLSGFAVIGISNCITRWYCKILCETFSVMGKISVEMTTHNF